MDADRHKGFWISDAPKFASGETATRPGPGAGKLAADADVSCLLDNTGAVIPKTDSVPRFQGKPVGVILLNPRAKRGWSFFSE